MTLEQLLDDFRKFMDEKIEDIAEAKDKKELEAILESRRKQVEKIIELLTFSLIVDENNFYGQFIIRMNRCIRYEMDAAAGVSFKGLYFELAINPLLFFMDNTVDQMKAILIHEIYHVCNNHIARGKKFPNIPHYIKNIAMDLSINQFIPNIPEWAVRLENIDKFIPSPLINNYKLEPFKNFEYYLQIFKDILDNDDSFRESMEKTENGGLTNDQMDKLKEKLEELAKTGKLSSGIVDSHETMDESDLDCDDNEIKNALQKIFLDAKKESRGTVPGGIQQAIDSLFTPPVIPWQTILKRYVGTVPVPFKKTIARRDRRQPHRGDIRGRLNDHAVDIVVALDTSGSMSNKDIAYALSEVLEITKNVKSTITVLECDMTIAKEYTIKEKKDIQFNVKGRGGTAFLPVFEYMQQPSKRNSLLVYFTDGYGENEFDIKLKHYRTLWVLNDQSCHLSVRNLPKGHDEQKTLYVK